MLPSSTSDHSSISNYGTTTVNVSPRERLLSVAAGAFLFTRGVKNFSLVKTLLGGYLVYRGASGHCPAYAQLQRSGYTSRPENVNIKTQLIVNKPRAEVYEFWRKLENLPLFMKHLKSVNAIDDTHSHWEASLGTSMATLSWDAKIVKEEEGSLLAWSSLPGASVENAGKVDFKDALGGQGTELNIVITYRPPAGKFGEGVATLLNPVFTRMIKKDVSNFKQYIEGTVDAVAS